MTKLSEALVEYEALLASHTDRLEHHRLVKAARDRILDLDVKEPIR